MSKTDKTFEANGKLWQTDEHTLSLLHKYRAEGNEYMVGAVFELGISFGRIVEVTTNKEDKE